MIISNYVKLNNTLITDEKYLSLGNAEYMVFVYLCSIAKTVKDTGVRWAKVKQTTIAKKCGFTTRQTAGRAIQGLIQKGHIKEALRFKKRDGNLGTYTYILDIPSVKTGGYFCMGKGIFNCGLTALQLKVYMYSLKAHCVERGLSWNSFNDISADLGVRKDYVVRSIRELQEKGLILRQRQASATSVNAYGDNIYFIIIISRGQIGRKRVWLCSRQKHSHTVNNSIINIINYIISHYLVDVKGVYENIFLEG